MTAAIMAMEYDRDLSEAYRIMHENPKGRLLLHRLRIGVRSRRQREEFLMTQNRTTGTIPSRDIIEGNFERATEALAVFIGGGTST